jgi:pimeloyl-ACP methyl ester carboxylesterase
MPRPLVVAACLALPVLAVGLAVPACSVGEKFLVPSPHWVAEPSALGLAYEEVVLPTGDDTNVHGWFVPSEASDGRTVVICHGNAANISFYHPYYRFLHEAGFHVFLFDYRGYGKSRGELSVDALFTDANAALAHVFARPEVDVHKVMLFGTSLGAIVALRAAAEHPQLAGIVIENAPSPHEALRKQAGWFLTFWVELLALPGGIEPVDNAGRYAGPALFLCGAWDPLLRQHLEAAAAHAGPTANWVLPETGHAPAGLLQHDGEYEETLVRFLRGCADGRAPRIEVGLGDLRDGTVAVAVERRDLGDGPLAVELALVDGEGNARFERFWLHGEVATRTFAAESVPRFAAAWPRVRVEGDPGETAWRPVAGPLRRAADAMPILHSLALMAANTEGGVVHARSFATTLAWQEQELGVLPPLAAAELIPDFVAAGRVLAASGEPGDRDTARRLLERAVAAEPADPRLHYWPASRYVAGFAHTAAIDEARELLAGLGAGR